jgi:hypothetical protein
MLRRSEKRRVTSHDGLTAVEAEKPAIGACLVDTRDDRERAAIAASCAEDEPQGAHQHQSGEEEHFDEHEPFRSTCDDRGSQQARVHVEDTSLRMRRTPKT